MKTNAERLMEIFAQAKALLSPAEREGYLTKACQGDADLRREVESLLAANSAAGDFLPPPVPVGASAAQKTMLLPPLSEVAGTRIGRYKLLEQIGEGGFGVVWMAEQEEPVRRRVALKIIKLGMDTREVVARFEAERQALAMMDHPNIASVFDGGATETGRPYFVMELVKGIPITDYCDADKLSTRERLELFMQVCHAVQHAHQKGVIHRDLKPSNILVTVKDDQPVPKVIDFGIAKATQARLTEKTIFTRFQQWIGTPAYMSPEQAGLGSLDVDTRSDVYSLGVLLYELLTGRPPFDTQKLLAAGYDAVMRTIREEEPPKPSTRLSALQADELSQVATHRHAEPAKLERAVQGDLDWIVMKALEKNRTRRYDTANALARDLEHHLNNEPVSAVAPTFSYRLQKLARRHRKAAAWTASFALLLVLTALVSTILAIYAQRQKTRAEQAENITGDNLYAADMGLANQALGNGRIIRARELLEAYIPRSGQIDRRGLEWRHLWGRCRGEQLAVILGPSEAAINGLGITPDDAFLVAADAAGRLRVIRLEDFQVVCTTNVFEGSDSCAALAISADGKRVAVSGSDCGLVCVWELSPDGNLAFLRRIKTFSPFGLAFSPDCQKLAVGTGAYFWTGDLDSGGITKLFDVLTGKELGSLPESGGRAVAFSPDGKWLATGPWHGWNLKIWDAGVLKLARTIQIRTPIWAQFSADSQSVLTGTPFGEANVYRLSDSAPTAVFPKRAEAGHGALSADGRWAAAASGRKTTIALLNLQTHATRELVGLEEELRSLAFSHDGEFLVSGDASGSVLLWSVNRDGIGHARLRENTTSFRSLPLPPSSPDGEKIAVRVGNVIKILNARTGQIHPILPTPSFLLAFQDDNTLITIQGLYGLEVRNRLKPTWLWSNTVPCLEFWNLTNLNHRSVELTAVGKREISAVAISPDCKLVAMAWRHGNRTNGVMLVTPTGEVRFSTADFDRTIYGLAFSPDGRRLAVAMASGKVQILEPPSPDSILTLRGGGDVAEGAVFSPSGDMLAACGSKSVRVWSLPAGKELACFLGQLDNVFHVRFSADSRTLIGYGALETKLWHLPTKRELLTMSYSEPRNLIPLTGEAYASTAEINTGGPQLWDVSKLPSLAGAEEWLRAQPASLTEVRRLLYAIPPRDAKAASTLIPLDRYYRAGLDRNWHGGMAGNDLGPLPRGVQVFNSTAFDIRGLVLPHKTGDNVIQVGQPCHRLRFLHNATGHGIKPGLPVGRYLIRYADGQTAEVPLVTGQNIQDWWADPASLTSSGEASVAWVGTNAPSRKENRSIHLLALTWPNPRPAVPIQTVTLEQIGNVAEPFLVAVTAE